MIPAIHHPKRFSLLLILMAILTAGCSYGGTNKTSPPQSGKTVDGTDNMKTPSNDNQINIEADIRELNGLYEEENKRSGNDVATKLTIDRALRLQSVAKCYVSSDQTTIVVEFKNGLTGYILTRHK